MTTDAPRGLTIIRKKQVCIKTGLPPSSVSAKYGSNPRRPSDYDSTFPTPIKISRRGIGWIEEEVDAWIRAQIRKSREGSPAGNQQEPVGGDK